MQLFSLTLFILRNVLTRSRELSPILLIIKTYKFKYKSTQLLKTHALSKSFWTLHVFSFWHGLSCYEVLLLELFTCWYLRSFNKLVVFKCEDSKCSCQQIYVVKSFFEDNLSLVSSMSFVIWINNNQFVRFIFKLV